MVRQKVKDLLEASQLRAENEKLRAENEQLKTENTELRAADAKLRPLVHTLGQDLSRFLVGLKGALEE